MGTRLYLINGLINGTLSEAEKKSALSNPVILHAIKAMAKVKSEKTKNKKSFKKGDK